MVLPHDADWAARAQGEALRLLRVAGGVEHIGSTAVNSLHGRPTIDLMVGARLLEQRQNLVVGSLKQLGYVRSRRKDVPGTILLEKPDRSFCIHLVEMSGGQWRANLAVRDYLRAFDDDAVGYDRARKLAAAKAKSESEYRTLMKPVLDQLVRRAVRWRLANPR